MNEDVFNVSIRKFLKTLGVSAQREIDGVLAAHRFAHPARAARSYSFECHPPPQPPLSSSSCSLPASVLHVSVGPRSSPFLPIRPLQLDGLTEKPRAMTLHMITGMTSTSAQLARRSPQRALSSTTMRRCSTEPVKTTARDVFSSQGAVRTPRRGKCVICRRWCPN